MRVEKIVLPGSGYGAGAATLTAYVQDKVDELRRDDRPRP